MPLRVAVNGKGEVFISAAVSGSFGTIYKFNSEGQDVLQLIFTGGVVYPEYMAADLEDHLYVVIDRAGDDYFYVSNSELDQLGSTAMDDASGIAVE